MYLDERERKLAAQKQLSAIKLKFKKSKKETWKEIKESENPSEQYDCIICL